MFFSRLNKAGGGGSKNPHHPQNSTKNTTTVKEPPKKLPQSRNGSPSKVTKDVKKRKANRKPSSSPGTPASISSKLNTPAESSADEDDGEENGFERLKSTKRKLHPTVDPDRVIYKEYENEDGNDSKVSAKRLVDEINGSDKYSAQFDTDHSLEVTLELPFGREEYRIQRPKRDDEFNPLSEIESVMETISQNFVPEKDKNTIKDEMMRDSIVRRMRRSVKNSDSEKFKTSINEFNDLMKTLRDSGEIAETIKSMKVVHFKFVSELLNQVYARMISPRTQELRNYKAFSNNVYGELLPPFTSKVFRQTKMTSKSVFIDLGSGVGNCVLQSALEIGCESWGCEIMKVASSYGADQQKELEHRIKSYNIGMGDIQLRSADFVNNSEIQGVLRRADVVLVNNYAFDAELNGNLIDMFLDLKEGAKIVSLKSFVPPDYVISEANIESPLNILRVESKQFSEGDVSWQANGGKYYISTIDRTQLEKALNSRKR